MARAKTARRPPAWLRARGPGSGRSFPTVPGHAKEAYTVRLSHRHLLGGLNWAARAAG
ncbi:ThuA domain-containing protein [Streptomyces sp. NPDC057197]|uniref:ThuA domain-containing protein n=1 Tax=unclassified Streptomyces TaxID=2593676 RepID=UPI003641ABBE